MHFIEKLNFIIFKAVNTLINLLKNYIKMYFLFKYNSVCFCRLYKILFSLVHKSCSPKAIVFGE